jgi:hypothetical protein
MKLHKRLIFGFFIALLTLSWSIKCLAAPPGGWMEEETVTTTHFEIHWEGSSTSPHYATDSWINKVKQYLENAWSFQVPTWGRPPGVVDNSVRITVEVWNRPKGEYGATSWGKPTKSANMKLDNDYNPGSFTVTEEDGLKMTTGHEFFHCVQPNWIDLITWNDSTKNWFTEGTAEWMEDQMYNSINHYVVKDEYGFSRAKAFLDYPEVSLDQKRTGCLWLCPLLAIC